MDNVQIIGIIATAVVFATVLELVRRRRLVERYALLWMLTAFALLVLAIWRDLLDIIAEAAGISFPPNALFIAGFAVVFLLLLNFSVAVSRLSEETKVLAQEIARLDDELRTARGAGRGANGAGEASAARAEEQQDRAPVPAEQGAQDR